jgi:myo-inositol 2-dehydrogenase/D-chiro-inositol 1-dehydrogenase
MTVKIGVIGAGMIGMEHAERITNKLVGGEIVAVNDVNPDQSKRLIEKLNLNAKVYEDGHKLITSNEVDAVLVTSWGPTHEEFVLSALASNKYVFCEKPLATSEEGCRRIVDAEIKGNKRLVQVGFMRRYDRGYQMLKSTLDERQLGEPLMLHCAHRNPEVPEAYVTPMAITDTLIHEIDVFRWLLKEDYTSAQVIFPRKTRNAHSKVKDPQIVLLETTSGVRIDVEIFVNCKYGYDIQCSVVSEEGVANLPEPQSLQVRSGAQISNDILTDWKKRFADAFDVELQQFINSVASDKLCGPAPSAWDGLAAAVAGDACVKAQETGAIETISMPDQPAFYQN